MAYTVALPDGRTVEFPDTVSRDQAAEIIKQQLGIKPGGAAPESGGIAAFKAGLESLKGSTAALLGKTGFMDIDAAAKYQQEKETEAQNIFKPTEKSWSEAPLTKLAELGGGSAPYMLAPIAAGASVLALPEAAAAAPILGGLTTLGSALGLTATGLTSAAQFTGTNLARQIQEGKTLQQTELAPAVLASLPQAALDMLPLGYLPGVRQLIPGVKQIFAKAGKDIPEKVAEQIAKQGTIATLKDYGASTLKSMGAEGITEAAQQFFERLQAGLSLTDEKARSEYFDNFIGGAVLGGTLAPAGRYVERGQIAAEQAKTRKEEEAKIVQQQQAFAEQEKAQQEAYRQTDPYLTDVQQRYNAMQEQYRKLIEATSVKPAKDDLAGQAQLKEARKALSEFKQDNANAELASEYAAVSKRIEAKQTEQEQARINAEGMKKQGAQADLFGAPTQTDQTPLAQIEALTPRIKDLDTQIAAAQKEGDQQKLAALGNQRQQLQSTLEPLLPSRQELTEARNGIARMQEATKARMLEAKTDNDVLRHAQQLDEYKQALTQLEKYDQHVAPAPETDRQKIQTTINKLRSSLENAKTLGDHEQVLNIMPKLKELEAQNQPQLFETGKEGFAYPEIVGDKELADEMAAGRQRAAKLRESLDAESAKLRGFSERQNELTPFQIGLAKQRLEDARRLRDQFAAGERDWTVLEKRRLERAQQLTGKAGDETTFNQNWSKLKPSAQDIQYHQDRTKLRKTLKERIVALYREMAKAPEAPADAETFDKELAALKDRVLQAGEKPPRFKQDVKKELDATQQSLADLERRIAIGEKYRQKGEVADNIITKETDARVADLLDRLLPGAIKPSKETPKPAPRRVAELPIQLAQDQLNKLKDAQALLKSLNKQIQAAGKPTDPAKIDALETLKEQRKDVQREAAAAQKTYNRLAELEQPGAAPKAEPTQGDLFGGVQETGDRLSKVDAQLKKLYAEFNAAKAELTRRGQEATTPQLQELLDKFAKTPPPRIQEMQAEIEKLEDQRASISGERSKQYADYLSAQEQEAPAPEQRSFDKRLTGFKETIIKAPTKEELDAARTKYVELQTMAESIRSAIAKQTSDGGKALREAATRLQVELESKTQEFGGTFEGFRKKSTVTEANAKALQDEYAPRIKRLLNMANMAAAAKKTGTIPKALETALEKANADQAKAKETIDKLEAQRRMAEQQQAVITGATPGEAEAQRLLAGKGYRTAEGFVRTAPKKKESWGITSVPKAKEAKPSEIAKAASEIEKAKSLIAATTKAVEEKNVPANLLIGRNQSKLAALQKAVDALDPQANDTFAPEKSADIFTEIQDLQEEIGQFGTQEQFDGLSAIIKGIDVAREKGITRPANLYLAPFKRYEGMVKNTEAQVDALDAKLNQLKAEYDTAIKNEGKKAPVVVQAAVEDVINRATVVDKSHTKALLAYKIARRDMLAYQYEMGKDVREQYRAAVQALQAEVERQGKDTAIPAAIKERDAAVAKLQSIQDRLAKAEAKLQEAKGKERARVKAAETLPLTAKQAKEKADEERRLAILRGESTELQKLPLMRVERDTTTPLAQAVQTNAKKMLGMAQAALEKATTNAEKEEATLMVQRYERELAEAYVAGERKVTTEGGYAGKADVSEDDVYELQQPETGERLAPRKEGPLVREARQAPGQFIGAALDVKQGSRNPPRQAGAIKLRAADLDPSSANAISLFVTKGKLEGAKEGKSKDKLEAAYKNATEGLTEAQIAEQLAEGKRLLSTGESLEVIAANEKRRQARLELVQAESYLRTAKTPATKEIAQDDVDMKQAAYDAADRKYEAVKTAAAAQKFKGTEQADAAVEADIEETEKSRTRRAIEDSGFEFSKGAVKKGITANELQEELDKAIGGKGITQRRVQIFNSIEDFYAKDGNAQYDYPNLPVDAKAFVDPKTNQAFMFANNIGKGEGLGVFLHEVGVHLGFRNLFNAGQYNALVKAAKTWATKKDGSLEARVAKAAVERVEAAKTSTEQYDDELLAYTVEEAIKAGAMPSALKKGSPITSWLSTVLNLLKKALAKFGINPAKLTAGDLVNLAYGAAQLEVRGTWHGSDATFEAFDTTYAGTGEGSFDRRFDGDNSLGAGPYVTPNKEYAEYYQYAVPMGKAANETSYGFKTYQDYRDMDEKFMTKDNADLSVAELQNKYESLLLTRYLTDVNAGGDLDPTKNALVQQTLHSLQKMTDPKVVKAIATLSADKIKGLTKRPTKGNLYKTLDDIPSEKVFSVNSMAVFGERPEIDALREKYNKILITRKDGTKVDSALKDNVYPLNSLFYKMRQDLGIDKTIELLKAAGIEAIEQKNERKYIERAYINNAPEILAMNLNPVGPAKDLLFSRGAVESAFIGTQAGRWETFKGNLFGLSGRVQLVDRLAAVDEALVKAEGAGKLSETEAFQTQYFMRLADNTTQAAGQFITNGPIRIVSEKRSTGTEYRYQSETGATLVRMSEFLEQASKAGIESPAKAEIIATAIIAGERAQSVPNGWSRLFAADPAAAKAEYDGYVAYLNANPEAKKYIDAVKTEYKKYNDGLMDFAMDCDYISPEDAAAFKRMPYIPFYRIDNGNVKLFTDKEHSITIGNIKDNPDLAKMVGDNKHIMPLLTSAVQNTFMLTRVSMANKATHETASSLYKAGFSTKMGKGSGLASVNTVHYKIKGKPAFAVIDADTFGIPAHLIVKGMEGIKTTIPALVQMMGIPADVLRKFVTRTPAYAARQLIRDPVNAFMLGGVDGVPMVGALKEMAKMRAGTSESEQALMRGLAISSNVYSGNEKDMQKFLSDIASGKGKWTKMLGMLDTMALQADAATRATIYQDSLNKGFSEAQAQFRALESQNFSRRGLSPSMQMLSTLIPFFNAQVQGLDVLYRSLRGKMPFNERLDIRRKIAMRGAMLTTVAIAYALAMQDDDAYKKASPEERYNNFFVRIPGVKDPLKIPIPYEIGILFKALPEAILDAAMRDTTAKEAALGMGKLILQSAPGAIPLSGKPIIEAYYGATSQGLIESPREQELKAPYRYRETTTEVAKLAGSFTGAVGVSPIMLEHLVRGYTGSLGLAALHMLDPLLAPSGEGEKASLSAAQQPFIGGMFQRAEGRWLIDRAYNRMDAVVQAQKTFDDLVSRGRKAEAKAFAQQYSTDLMLADDAGSLRKEMGELFSLDRAIRSDPRMSTAEKDKRLERIKLLENRLAEQFVTAVDKTRLQYARP